VSQGKGTGTIYCKDNDPEERRAQIARYTIALRKVIVGLIGLMTGSTLQNVPLDAIWVGA
jgi:hypothetical protein